MSTQTPEIDIADSFIASLNEEQHLVQNPDITASDTTGPEEPEPVVGEEVHLAEEYAELEPDYDQEEDEDDPDWMEDLVEAGENLSTEDLDSLAEGFTVLITESKELLQDFYDRSFDKAIRKELGEGKEDHLLILEYAWIQYGDINFDSISNILDSLKDKTKRFNHIDFVDLLPLGLKYKRLRKSRSTKPMKDSHQRGIEKYSKLTFRKYLSHINPDPAVMLTLYLGLAFGSDLLKIGKSMLLDK